jgi:hypothetical protein
LYAGYRKVWVLDQEFLIFFISRKSQQELNGNAGIAVNTGVLTVLDFWFFWPLETWFQVLVSGVRFFEQVSYLLVCKRR